MNKEVQLEISLREATVISAMEMAMYHACGYNTTCYTVSNSNDIITKENITIIINKKNLTVNGEKCASVKELVNKVLDLIPENEKVKTLEFMENWYTREYYYIN